MVDDDADLDAAMQDVQNAVSAAGLFVAAGYHGMAPDQLARYIENGGFWQAHVPEECRWMRPFNRAYQDWAVEMGFYDKPFPYVFQIYSEPLRKFQLAAEGHAPSIASLGDIKLMGSGTEPDYAGAIELALDDEGLAIDDQLIVGARVGDLARPQLEGRGLGVDAGLAEADDRVGTTGDHPDRHRLAAGLRVEGIDPERGERRVHRALEHRHQVRLPLISTRGRVQIGSGLDCTCSMTQRANCWSTACLA